jgi:hypothetical protein
VLLAAKALPAACLVWLGLRPTVVRTLFFHVVFAGSLFMGFIATGSRSGIVVPIAMALAIWALTHRRIPFLATVALVATSLLIVGIGAEFREKTGRVDTVQEVEIDSGLASGLVAGAQEHVDRATQASPLTAILGRVPDEVEFLYGRSYLSIPAAVIPSAVWPEKPEAAGQLTGHLIFGFPKDGAGVPPGTVGEAFWNFHVPGVIVVFFLWGRLAQWLAVFYQDHANDGGIMSLFVITLVGFYPHSVSFYSSLHSVAAGFLALVLFSGFPRLRKSRHAVYRRTRGAA